VRHGPNETEKKSHADQSEQAATVDRWADIARKTFIIAVVSLTVWAGCSVMRLGVVFGTERLFGAADALGANGFWLGAGALLGVMLLVGILRGLLLLRPAWRDAEGDGIDKALGRFHETYKGGGDDPAPRYAKPTFSNAIRKIVMTVLTIGAGGSGGLEAPGVYLGESLGAGWSRLFKRPSADELRLYQLAGISAAVATLLAAPFTAAIFAAEIVYAGRIIYQKLAYCLIAGVLAYEFNVHFGGHATLFTVPGHSHSFVWQEYLLVVLVAVGFSAPAAIALGPIIRTAERFFSKFSVVSRAAVGALLTGVIAIGAWYLLDLHPSAILGTGEEVISDVIKGTGEAVLQTWWILLLAVVAKTFATAATVKSGGSVGLLFPAMYLGALVGAAAYYLLGEIGLYAGPTVAVYAAAGMAAALTSIAGVPLASIALVVEAFGSEYSPAAAVACAVCFTVSRRFGLYARTPNTEREENDR
jgi:CIC family chloride channel protein